MGAPRGVVGWVGGGGSRGGVVCAVVGGAFCGGAERGVCFGDGDEAGGRRGVVGVVVWVVGFGECVELSN